MKNVSKMSRVTTIITLGILFSILLGCKKPPIVDYKGSFDHVFVNETVHDIKDFGGLFPISAGESRTQTLEVATSKFLPFPKPGKMGIYFDRLNEHRSRYGLNSTQPVELVRFR